MRIKDIIEHFKIICEETGIHPKEECLFDNAIKIFISDRISENKRENIKSINESREIKQEFPIKSDKPTEKQLNFLKRNKIRINPGITKEEAKIIISEIIKENNAY